MYIKRSSLATRLMGLSTLIIILTVLILSAVVYYGFQEKNKEQIQQKLSAIAQAEANKIESTLKFERVNLFSWRTSSVMLDTIVDDLDKRIQNEFIQLKKNYQLTGHLYAFNKNGVLIASSQPGVLGVSLPKQWQLKEKKYRFIPAHTIDFIHNTDDIAAFVIDLTLENSLQQGTLVLTHPWNTIWQQLISNDYQFAFYHHNPEHLDLISSQGIIHYPIEKAFNQQKIWQFNGQDYLGALSKSEVVEGDFALHIAAFITIDKANESQVEVFKLLNIAACIVIIPLILLAMVLSHRFVAPINKLTKMIRGIEESNDLSMRLSIDSKDEVADLANTFNRMMVNLAQSFYERESISKEIEYFNQNLELKVYERTQELAETVEQLKNTQLQLVQSEKMTSLGQLVAGVAHEINNPIGSIYANVQPLKDYSADLQEAVVVAQKNLEGEGLVNFNAFLEEIDYDFMYHDLNDLLASQHQAAQRIKKIILALRNFSRLDQGDVKSVLLEEGIDSTLQILHHEYKNRITIEKDYQFNQEIECYASELNQVFMNILANAIQAIPTQQQGIIQIKSSLEDKHAVICISDNGPGIPDEVKLHIFEPFFTTKEIGKGTGLGLSISYGIIEKHRGSISVDSTLNQGTIFTIKLPLELTES